MTITTFFGSTELEAPKGFRIVYVAFEPYFEIRGTSYENVFVIGLRKEGLIRKEGLKWIRLPPGRVIYSILGDGVRTWYYQVEGGKGDEERSRAHE